MKPWQRLGLLVFGLVTTNTTTWTVLEANLRQGVYRPEADSVAIPIVESVALSVAMLPALAIVALVPTSAWIKRRRATSQAWRVMAGAAIVMSYALAMLFATAAVAKWAIPHHYVIAASYCVLFGAVLALLVTDVRPSA